jgi:hypothetical protein
LADFLSSIYFANFLSSELCNHWLTKNERCLRLVVQKISQRQLFTKTNEMTSSLAISSSNYVYFKNLLTKEHLKNKHEIASIFFCGDLARLN